MAVSKDKIKRHNKISDIDHSNGTWVLSCEYEMGLLDQSVSVLSE